MCTSLPSLGWTVFFPRHLNLHLTPSRPLHPATPHSDLCGSEDVFLEEKDRDKCLKRDLYISKDRKVKPKHFVNIKLQYSYVRNKHGCGDQNLFWGLIGPPVTQRHACFPILLLLLCICNSRRCCSPHFLNSLINKTAITMSAVILFPRFLGTLYLCVFTFQEAMPGSGGPGMGPSQVIIIGQRRHAENAWLWLTAGL